MAEIFSLQTRRGPALDAAAKEIRNGGVVVFPTDTVYGVGGDAFNQFATARIFEIKKRPRSMPLPVLVAWPRQAWALCSEVPRAAADLAAAFWPGGLTLILPAADGLSLDLGNANGRIAVRMPAHDDLLELIASVGPMASTSANLSGAPTPSTVEGIRAELGEAVGVYLDGGPAASEAASTIVDCSRWQPKIVREGAIPIVRIEQALGRA